MLSVEVHLYSQSEPILISNVRNAYTKDGLYCVMTSDMQSSRSATIVYKFPLQHIFRIKETEL